MEQHPRDHPERKRRAMESVNNPDPNCLEPVPLNEGAVLTGRTSNQQQAHQNHFSISSQPLLYSGQQQSMVGLHIRRLQEMSQLLMVPQQQPPFLHEQFEPTPLSEGHRPIPQQMNFPEHPHFEPIGTHNHPTYHHQQTAVENQNHNHHNQQNPLAYPTNTNGAFIHQQPGNQLSSVQTSAPIIGAIRTHSTVQASVQDANTTGLARGDSLTEMAGALLSFGAEAGLVLDSTMNVDELRNRARLHVNEVCN